MGMKYVPRNHIELDELIYLDFPPICVSLKNADWHSMLHC